MHSSRKRVIYTVGFMLVATTSVVIIKNWDGEILGSRKNTKVLLTQQKGSEGRAEAKDFGVVLSVVGKEYLVVFENEDAIDDGLLRFIGTDLRRIFSGATISRERELATRKEFDVAGQRILARKAVDFLFEGGRNLAPRQFVDNFGFMTGEDDKVVMTAQLLGDYRTGYKKFVENRRAFEALTRDLGVINRKEVVNPREWFYPTEKISELQPITKESFEAGYGAYRYRVPSFLEVRSVEEWFGQDVWALEPEWESRLRGKLLAQVFIEISNEIGMTMGPLRFVYDESDNHWKFLVEY